MPEATLITAGMSLIQTVISIVAKALQGDPASVEKLRRVEDVLTDSPTEQVWRDALAKASKKS